MSVTEEMFINWKQHPVTEEVMTMMRRAREGHIMDLASDAYILNPAYAQLVAKWTGCISVINDLLDIRYETIIESVVIKEEEND